MQRMWTQSEETGMRWEVVVQITCCLGFGPKLIPGHIIGGLTLSETEQQHVVRKQISYRSLTAFIVARLQCKTKPNCVYLVKCFLICFTDQIIRNLEAYSLLT